MRRVAVGDIMTRNFAYVSPNTNLLATAKEMVKQRIDSLLITEGRKLLGIITSRDILWTIVKKPGIDLKSMDVMDIATRKIAVIKPTSDISEALHKMKQFGFRRLPVLLKGEIVGVITLKDILRIEPGVYSMLGELAGVKEESEKMKRLQKYEGLQTEGLCDSCGALAELVPIGNKMLCRDCREEIY